jgi:superfamily II DNA or RNA helicase
VTVAEAPFHSPPPAPEDGQLAKVRGRWWVVAESRRDSQADLDARAVQHLVRLVSVEDDATGEELEVVWEIEPGTEIRERAELPAIAADGVDDPVQLDAFLDAVRWGAVTSADQRRLQAPFRAGIDLEDFQLEPLVRALRMPRTTLLIADDVGLGKTIEAGLVVQELLLRHRARTALIVAPAGLQRQWRDEMQEKFGLEFRIVDRELLGQLRRSRGVGANPFAHFPRLIVSIDWLKGELGMRLLREALPPYPEIPRRYDVLIVDEVHNCAPSGSGTARYARDSLRTTAIRTLAPHCEHRLFLSATPHNGYENSFAALLELLDPHRFARGILPAQQTIDEVTVRRLKTEITNADGTPRFARRSVRMLEVDHPDSERVVHADLTAYAAARARRVGSNASGVAATDFVTTLLKKRLFSSPAAFLRTLEVHRETLARRARPAARPAPPPTVLTQLFADAADAIDEERAPDGVGDATRDALEAAAEAAAGKPSPEEERLLDAMHAWARRAAVTEDARTTELLDWVQEQVAADERVIVFTEYRATQRYLQERLVARGMGGDLVELLDGTTDDDERERIKRQWQEEKCEFPVRILLATDAASEGISLQRQCHLLAHAEIPWNPNRLEQRNGRVDRHGQPAPEVLVHHCVSAGWKRGEGRGSVEGDLDFLARVVQKVEQIREDLGSAGPVIADQVEQAMLGRRQTLDDAPVAARRSATMIRERRRMDARLAELRDELLSSRDALNLSPESVERVVATALALAGQPSLRPLGDGEFDVPAFTASWARTTIGLEHPAFPGRTRPITFDQERARGRTDVVLAHLGHPLVQRSLGLLRAEVWGSTTRLHRVSARFADGALDRPVALAHGRLVITGATGHRLHEELITAGVRLGGDRLNVEQVTDAVAAAHPHAASPALRARFMPQLQDGAEQVRAALQARAGDRARTLGDTLRVRARQESEHVAAVLTELSHTIRREALTEEQTGQGLLFSDFTEAADRRQVERDRRALEARLENIPAEIAAEQAAITKRYAQPEHRLFPAAVELLIPEGVRLA